MDGKVVDRALAEVVRPALRELGFTRFRGRHAWRRNPITIDLVTFPSFSSYIADGVGSTSYSFGGEAGVYYPTMEDEAVEWPRGYDLTFRGFLNKNIRQPLFHPWGRPETSDRPDVWLVLADGSNLAEVVEDALVATKAQALPFIQRFNDPEEAMVSLKKAELTRGDFGQLEYFAGNVGTKWHDARVERLQRIIDEPR
jgi:hypothetical protein